MNRSSPTRLFFTVLVLLFLMSTVTVATPAETKKPIKVGLIVPTTGVVSAPGKQMKKGWELWWDQQDGNVAGRDVITYVEDSAGDPSTGRVKAKRLVEQKGVDILVGPVLANVGLAIADYVEDKDVLLAFPVVADDAITKQDRQHNVLRVAGWSGSQVTHPMGEWASKQGYERAVTIGNDYNFGHQNVGGFVNTFTDEGGQILKQFWNPIGTSNYGSYFAQIMSLNPDVVFAAEVGADAVRFVTQWNNFGLKSQIPLLGNPTLLKQSNLSSMGDEVLGVKAVTRYSAARETPANRQFVKRFDRRYGELPAAEAAATYTAGKWFSRAFRALNGRIGNLDRLIEAVKNTSIEKSPLGSLTMDDYGNPIIDVYLVEAVKRSDGRKWNRVLKTWEQVSQFWKYDPQTFMERPSYNRSFQGMNE